MSKFKTLQKINSKIYQPGDDMCPYCKQKMYEIDSRWLGEPLADGNGVSEVTVTCDYCKVNNTYYLTEYI